MNIYTIGFAGKTAKDFFQILMTNQVKQLIDIRLNNSSQLAGFTNIKHLPYFLFLHNIKYTYAPQYAPSKELLNGYQDKLINWAEYEKIYLNLLQKRNILENLDILSFNNSVLLCSEATAEKCHRRLLAEYLAKHFPDINIKHL